MKIKSYRQNTIFVDEITKVMLESQLIIAEKEGVIMGFIVYSNDTNEFSLIRSTLGKRMVDGSLNYLIRKGVDKGYDFYLVNKDFDLRQFSEYRDDGVFINPEFE